MGFPETPTYPDIAVTITYQSGSPIPASGGNLDFDVLIQNQSGQAQNMDAWLASEYEGGPPTTLVMRNFPSFPATAQINRPGMYYPVPGGWAGGDYMLMCRVGDEPATVWAEDGFPFTKEGLSDGSFQPWAVDGAPNPFDRIDLDHADLPSEYAMLGAYPNPFNPATVLSYRLQAAGIINLSVYDISGRKVLELVNGWKEAGVHEVAFDGSGSSSGIYLYRLEAGSFRATGKMVLMK